MQHTRLAPRLGNSRLHARCIPVPVNHRRNLEINQHNRQLGLPEGFKRRFHAGNRVFHPSIWRTSFTPSCQTTRSGFRRNTSRSIRSTILGMVSPPLPLLTTSTGVSICRASSRSITLAKSCSRGMSGVPSTEEEPKRQSGSVRRDRSCSRERECVFSTPATTLALSQRSPAWAETDAPAVAAANSARWRAVRKPPYRRTSDARSSSAPIQMPGSPAATCSCWGHPNTGIQGLGATSVIIWLISDCGDFNKSHAFREQPVCPPETRWPQKKARITGCGPDKPWQSAG